MNVNETPYVETEVLLALLNDDEEAASALLRGMHENELRRFNEVAHQLRSIIYEAHNVKIKQRRDADPRVQAARSWKEEVGGQRQPRPDA